MDPNHVVNTSDTYVRRFTVYGTRTTFKFNIPPEGVSEINWLGSVFSSLVEKIKAEDSEGISSGLPHAV